MANGRSSNNLGLLGLGLFLGVGIVASVMIASEAALRIKSQNESIEVKGFAARLIISDWASWSARFTVRGQSLSQAHGSLERDRRTVRKFLKDQDVSKGQYELSPITTDTLFAIDDEGNITSEVVGYVLSQEVAVSSNDIELVTQLSKGASELVGQGVEISSYRPEYFYTQLDALKIEMLEEATENGRDRAKALAKKSKADIGTLRYARQGVFQITPAHSTEVSDYGRNDTSAIEKSVKAVVTVRYTIEK